MKALHLFPLLVLAFATTGRAATFTWSGTVNGQWTNGQNWGQTLPGIVPGSGDSLVFPAAGIPAGNRTMTNGYPANSAFWRMDFQGGNYSLAGNAFIMNASGGQAPRINISQSSSVATITAPFSIGNGLPGPALLEASAIDSTLRLEGDILALNPCELRASGLSSRVEVEGNITALAGDVTVGAGNGLVVLTGAVSNAALITVNGRLAIEADAPFAGAVTVATTGTLYGAGSIGLASTIHGVLEMGDDRDYANLSFNGTLTFGSGTADELVFDLANPIATRDQLSLTGSAGLVCNQAKLVIRQTQGISQGEEVLLINKVSAGFINDTNPFVAPDGEKILEGSIIPYGLNTFQFSYRGGDGNDFTATVVPTPSDGTSTWDGGAGAGNPEVLNINNWVGNTAPQASHTLAFPVAPNRTVELPGRANFYALNFTAGSYVLDSSSRIYLSGGITASHTAGIVEMITPIDMVAPQTFSLTGGGNLVLEEIATFGHTLTFNNTHATGAIFLNGAVSSSGGAVIKNGQGLLEMGGTVPNTYTGSTTVNRGELRVSRPAGTAAILGNLIIGNGTNPASYVATTDNHIADTSDVTVNALGTFISQGEVIDALNLNGGTVNTGAGTLVVMGNLTTTADSSVGGTHLNFFPTASPQNLNVSSGSTLSLTCPSSLQAGTTLAKTGAGTLWLFNTFSATNAVRITAGTLLVESSGGPPLRLEGATAKLRGTGAVGIITNTTAAAAATIAPGTDAAEVGTLTSGGLHLTTGAPTFLFTIGANQAQSDRIQVDGSVTLSNATLLLEHESALPPGTVLTLINNDGIDSVTGSFAGLPQGANILTVGGRYYISYQGGSGNDVVLIKIAEPTDPPVVTNLNITPATPSQFTRIGATLSGPAYINVLVQASPDLQNWQTVTSINLGATGTATLGSTNVSGTLGAETYFFRFGYPGL